MYTHGGLAEAPSCRGISSKTARPRAASQPVFMNYKLLEIERCTYITNGVSRLQTNKYNSTCWPYCHGHALPPRWLKVCNPARNGGAHDHHGFDHSVVL